MFNITYHQRNANQNLNEILSMLKGLLSTRHQTTSAGKDVLEK